MAEQSDLEFTASVVANTGQFVAELQRVIGLMRSAGASVNLREPFDAADQAARRASQSFRAVDLSLANMARTAKEASSQFILQQRQLREVESALVRIRELPITSRAQFQSLTELEGIQRRLQNNLASGVLRPETFAAAQTAMRRFVVELQAVERGERQVAELGALMNQILSSRIAIDPSAITTLTTMREQIALTGPIARTTYNNIIRGAEGVIRAQELATRSLIDQSVALNQVQAAGQGVVRGEQEMKAAILSRAAAQERAARDYEAALLRQARLLANLARMPASPERGQLISRVSTAVGPTEDPRRLNELNREYIALKSNVDSATTSVVKSGGAMKETTSIIDRMTTRLGTHLQIVASIGVAYTAFNALSAAVDHFVELDAAMHRISATIADQNERATLLPRSYALIQQGMTKFGLSTADAGKLVLELSRSLEDLTQVNAAFEPALALTVRGEVNMADATKVLIGSVNAFGTGLLGVTDPLEAFGAVADKIIRASNLSVGSIGTFSVALTNLAGRASVTNTTFDETLAALSLVQDSLGRAGQSGTGLARVFEGLLLHADQLAEIFQIDFDPLKAVVPIDLLTKTFAKLREEIRLTGGVTSETEAKIQKIIGTEQGTRIIELLVKDWEKFPARLKAIADSSGQHQRELAEHNAQLGVSFKNLTNSALIAFDSVLLGFSKIAGGTGGTPGEFSSLAAAFNTMAAAARAFGQSVESVGEKIGGLIQAIAKLPTPPGWLIGAPSSTPASKNLDEVASGLNTVGAAISSLPELPSWLKQLLFTGAAGAVAGVFSGGLLAVPAALAAFIAYDLTEFGLKAQKVEKDAEKAKKATEALARSMAAVSGHDPAFISDQAAIQESDRLANVNRQLKERAAISADIVAKGEAEIRQRNVDLALSERTAAARRNAAESSKNFAEAQARFDKGYNIGEKDRAAAAQELSRLSGKSVTDRAELNALISQGNKNNLAQQQELAELERKRASALRKLADEIATATLPRDDRGVVDPIAAAQLKAEQEFATLRTTFAEIGKGMSEAFAKEYESLIQVVVDAHKNIAFEAIAESLIAPYRNAEEENNRIIEKLVADTNRAMAQIGDALTPEKRTELSATPTRAIDKQIGLDKVQRDLLATRASLGQFGEDAQKAAEAASRGFASWDALVVTAGLHAEYLGDRSLQLVIDRFAVMRKAIKELDIDTLTRQLEIGAKQLNMVFSAGGDPALIEANRRAWDGQKKTFDELANSANAAERAIADVILAGVKQDLTKTGIDTLLKQINDLTAANSGVIDSMSQVGVAAIATGLKFQLMGQGVDVTNEKVQQLIGRLAALIQQQKLLSDIAGLKAIGFSPETARSMAEALALQDELNKKITDGTAVLARWNAQAETTYQNQLSLIQETAKKSGDVFTFLQASFEQSATQGHTFWNDLETLTKTTASNMASSMSDIFFALINNKLDDASAAFKNFFQGLLRSLLNFMSSQAVADFAKLFLGIGKGAASGIGGLFGSGAGAAPTPLAPAGTTVSLGVSSPAALESIGYDFTGLASGLSNLTTGLGAANTAIETMTGKSVAFSSVLSAIGQGWTQGEGLVGGIAGAWSGGTTALQTAISGMSGVSVALAGVGAALAVFDNIMAAVNGRTAEFATRLALGVAGGVAGGIWAGPAGALIGVIIGDQLGKWISKLFGTGPSNYEIKRQKAERTAVEGIQTVTAGYQTAARTADTSMLFNAIKGQAQGVGTLLLASPELAARLNIDPSKYGGSQISGGKFEVQWSDVTQTQFDELLRYLKEDPARAQGVIGGRVNVPYLNQGKVEGFQNDLAKVAEALLEQFVAFQKIRDEVKRLNDDISDAVKDFLPPELGVLFRRNILDPIGQNIIDVLTNPDIGLDEAQTKLKTYQATLEAYVSLTDLYGQITQDIAIHTGDFVDSLTYADTLLKRQLREADKRVEKAAQDIGLEGPLTALVGKNVRPADLDLSGVVNAIKAAFAKLDLSPVVAFKRLDELRQAIIARFELEKKLVLDAENNIQNLYEKHYTGILELNQTLAMLEISTKGTTTSLVEMITHLLTLGTTSLSIAEKLYTVTAALRLFINTLPTQIAGSERRVDAAGNVSPASGAGALPVDQIVTATMAVVVPFATAMNQMIRDAFDAGDFEAAFNLLQQLGAGLKDVLAAAVAGVHQWEEAQIASINAIADAQISEAGKVRDAYIAQFKPWKDALNSWREGIELQKEEIQAKKDGINDEIRLVRDLMKPYEDAIKAITKQQEALRRAMQPIDAEIRLVRDLMKPLQEQVKVLDRAAAMLRRNADDQLWAIKQQTDALNDQRKTITDQIALIEEFANAVLSVRKYLHDLALSNQAPPDALGQFQLAKQTFDALFQAYKKDPSAKGLADLQNAAGDLLNSLGPLFQRPSAEYRKLYDEIVRKLQKAGEIGAKFGDPADLDDLNDQLKDVDAKLKTLNDEADRINRKLERQLHAIELEKRVLEDQLLQGEDYIAGLEAQKDLLQRQIDLLELQKQPIQDLLDQGTAYIGNLEAQLTVLNREEEILGRTEATINRELGRIAAAEEAANTNYTAYADGVNKLRTESIDAIHKAAQDQIDVIRQALIPWVEAAARDANAFFTWMRDNQYARLVELTGGTGTAAWMRTAQESTAAALEVIKIALDGFLSGDMKTLIAAVQTPTPDQLLIETLNRLNSTTSALTNYLVTHGQPVGGPGGSDNNIGPFATGAWNVHPGTYRLDEGEMVVPQAPAMALRSAVDGWEGISRLAGGDGGRNTYISIAPVIHSNQNPTAIANQVVERIVIDIRGGGAIQDAIARMPKRSR